MTQQLAMAMAYRGERFYGWRKRPAVFELTGRSSWMWNTDGRLRRETDPIYASIPFYVAIAPEVSYGVFSDNPAKTMFYFYNTNYVFKVNDKRDDVYIFTGRPGDDEFKSIVEAYTGLTGKPYMPPLWGFGYHQCRYSYTNQAQTLWVAEQFAKNDLPVDSIWFDIDFMDRYMAFTYNRTAFPDPAAMNKKLLAQGIRTVAIVDPGIKIDSNYAVCREGLQSNIFIRYKDKYFTGDVWPGTCYFPDFTKASTQPWWENQYKRLLALGIEGYWNDMNEPSVFRAAGNTLPALSVQDNRGNPTPHMLIHNVYGHTMIEATYTALTDINPNRRPFVLTRSAYAGSQRYAFIWTGDNSSNWKHVRMNVSMAMNLGLSGMPYAGADIGGFCGSPAPELFVRWMQLGPSCPSCAITPRSVPLPRSLTYSRPTSTPFAAI
jgi:alpha-glucosidase